MIKSRRSRNAVAVGLLVLFAAAGVWAETTDVLSGQDLLRLMRERDGRTAKQAYANRLKEPKEPPVSDVNTIPAAKSADDELLKMVPAESLFCVRVNNFDYTLSQTDQFLAGASPMPMGVSMLVRMQFAKLLGSPDLKGVNMAGNFAIFATTKPGKSPGPDPSDMFIGAFIPVTDYEQFISGNPNCSEPDDKGVSKITSEGMHPLLVTQVGSYALISPQGNDNELIATAKSMSAAQTAGLAGTLDAAETRRAVKEPLWAYGNQLASKAFGPVASVQIEQIKTMAGATESGEQGTGLPSAIMNMDFEKRMKEMQFLSLTARPRSNALNIAITTSAVPGTETADMLVPDAPIIRELIGQFKAVSPNQMDAKTKKDLALIPKADEADFVGTYDLMNLFKMTAAMSPTSMPIPRMDIPTRSNIAFAGKVGNGRMTLEIALPKEHLMEIMAGFQMMMQQMMQQKMQPAPVSPDTSRGGGQMPMPGQPTTQPGQQDEDKEWQQRVFP